MRYAVISPVGISLLGRTFEKNAQERADRLRAGDLDHASVLHELQTCLQQYQNSGRIEESAAELKSLLAFQSSRGGQPPELLILLPTDTAESLLCAQALRLFFEKTYGWKSETRTVKGMDYKDPATFQHLGIRSLLSELSGAIRRCQEEGCEPVLNGTPGFKAETSLALLLAQFLGASVFYIHERMPGRAILLPSLRLTVTPEYWKRWGELVLALGKLSYEPPPHPGVMDSRRFVSFRQACTGCKISAGERQG
jgi:putative CRISPR-associated protein (TIGR02619 family)